MELKDKILKSIQKNPDRTANQVSRCFDGCPVSIVREVAAANGIRLKGGANKPTTPIRQLRASLPGGKEGFRNTFSKTVIQRQRTEAMHSKITKVINGELKKREWMTDAEMKELVGVSSADWSNLRRDYEQLLISDLVDRDRKKYTVWAHPDSIDELRAIANE